MKDKISQRFIQRILPILEQAKKDYFIVKLSGDKINTEDGFVPERIAVYNTCFAYSLTLREALSEIFYDERIIVYNQEPSIRVSWISLDQFEADYCS